MRRDAGRCSCARRLLVHFICVFLIASCFFTVCDDFNVLFLRQFSSYFCNSRFILKRNVFATEVYCQIYFFFSKCIYDNFFIHFQEK